MKKRIYRAMKLSPVEGKMGRWDNVCIMQPNVCIMQPNVCIMQPDRKKGKSDGNHVWTDELHRDFVSTVFEIGLRHATPNAIVELMTPNLDITNARVKSHLQRYRLNSGKSRKEFQSKFNGIYCSINARDEESKTAPSVCSPINEDNHVEKIYLPRLTAEEKDTPLGQAFGQVVGLMQNLTVQLEANRQREARESRAHTQEISSQDRPSPHNLTPLRLPSDTSTTTPSTQQSVRRQTIKSVNPYEPCPYYMTLQQASSLTIDLPASWICYSISFLPSTFPTPFGGQ